MTRQPVIPSQNRDENANTHKYQAYQPPTRNLEIPYHGGLQLRAWAYGSGAKAAWRKDWWPGVSMWHAARTPDTEARDRRPSLKQQRPKLSLGDYFSQQSRCRLALDKEQDVNLSPGEAGASSSSSPPSPAQLVMLDSSTLQPHSRVEGEKYECEGLCCGFGYLRGAIGAPKQQLVKVEKERAGEAEEQGQEDLRYLRRYISISEKGGGECWKS